MKFLNTLLDIIRRNPFTTLLFVVLIIAAPQLFGLVALLLLIPIIILVVGAAIMLVRLRKVQRDMENSMRDAQSRRTSTTPGASKPEGKVTVHIPHQEPKVSDDVGEYVDFKEE